MSDLEKLRNKTGRIISAKRKRKIQKRNDVHVWWSVDCCCYMWEKRPSAPIVNGENPKCNQCGKFYSKGSQCHDCNDSSH